MVDMDHAIVESCDTYFYDIAVKTGIERIDPFLAQFGFGTDTSLDVISALPGLLPNDAWKRGQRRGPWYPGDTVNLGIGQGFMLVTPLQLATATAILANKGKWISPHLLSKVNSERYSLPKEKIPDIELKNERDWERMFNSMERVITAPKGTATSLKRNLAYPIAGKTGTAQVVGIKQDEEYDSEALNERHRDHAWFMGFAPVDQPKIAIAVIIENGESSGKTAAPIAQSIINMYLSGQK